MVYMRGKYCLDEIGDSKDELKFKQGKKTVLTVYIHDDRYTFLIIFGRKERECFEKQKMYFQSIFVIYMKIREHIMMANGCLSIYLL